MRHIKLESNLRQRRNTAMPAYNAKNVFAVADATFRRPLVSALLPLFPLDLVLLPGAVLPLHIFEPRYKEMIGECLDAISRSACVRAKDGGVAEIGCTAEIFNGHQEIR